MTSKKEPSKEKSTKEMSLKEMSLAKIKPTDVQKPQKVDQARGGKYKF